MTNGHEEKIVYQDDDFLKQEYIYAVVLRGTPSEIQHLKELIADEQLQVIYQKTSLAELRIVEGTNNDDQ